MSGGHVCFPPMRGKVSSLHDCCCVLYSCGGHSSFVNLCALLIPFWESKFIFVFLTKEQTEGHTTGDTSRSPSKQSDVTHTTRDNQRTVMCLLWDHYAPIRNVCRPYVNKTSAAIGDGVSACISLRAGGVQFSRYTRCHSDTVKRSGRFEKFGAIQTTFVTCPTTALSFVYMHNVDIANEV
jgi:hypothetical protein